MKFRVTASANSADNTQPHPPRTIGGVIPLEVSILSCQSVLVSGKQNFRGYLLCVEIIVGMDTLGCNDSEVIMYNHCTLVTQYYGVHRSSILMHSETGQCLQPLFSSLLSDLTINSPLQSSLIHDSCSTPRSTTSRIVFEADSKFLIKFSVLLGSVGLFYESSY
ncbi:hypothetical protein RHMOL_RhmolUnG0003400 [Rhododendron molle]|nr:hypothetical protein RHMOL_RhmolUnG0003400 [Rhododendron molle]